MSSPRSCARRFGRTRRLLAGGTSGAIPRRLRIRRLRRVDHGGFRCQRQSKAAMRALFEHRGMLSMALGIACGAIVFTRFPFPAENAFLQMIALERPGIFSA